VKSGHGVRLFHALHSTASSTTPLNTPKTRPDAKKTEKGGKTVTFGETGALGGWGGVGGNEGETGFAMTLKTACGVRAGDRYHFGLFF
jgi:hypothetical protein